VIEYSTPQAAPPGRLLPATDQGPVALQGCAACGHHLFFDAAGEGTSSSLQWRSPPPRPIRKHENDLPRPPASISSVCSILFDQLALSPPRASVTPPREAEAVYEKNAGFPTGANPFSSSFVDTSVTRGQGSRRARPRRASIKVPKFVHPSQPIEFRVFHQSRRKCRLFGRRANFPFRFLDFHAMSGPPRQRTDPPLPPREDFLASMNSRSSRSGVDAGRGGPLASRSPPENPARTPGAQMGRTARRPC